TGPANPNKGPIFSIGADPTALTLIANYQSHAGYQSSTASSKTITFDYQVDGGDVEVSNLVDPILLDLGEAGIQLSGSVQFDMDGDGQAQQLAWTGGQDGVLAMDLDGSGAIESGREI